MTICSSVNFRRVLSLFSLLFLASCGGSGVDSTSRAVSKAEPQLFIAGGGIKGPLAFANVELYVLDAAYDELYEPGNPIAAATTNAYAEIDGLLVPNNVSPPYMLVIDGTNAIDRNTNEAPVIKKLVTIITEESLSGEEPIYATPYTTLAYQMLRLDPRDVRMTDSSISNSIAGYDQEIVRAVSFGIPSDISIFTTPPIINDSTTTVESQQRVVHHRAAIEAFSTLLYDMSSSSNPHVTTDSLLERLALDLHSDDLIDSSADGQPISGIDEGILGQNPMNATIPNTSYRVSDIVSLIDEERALIGDSADIVFYKDEMSVDLKASSLDANSSPTPSGPTPIDNSGDLGYPQPMGDLVQTLLASGLIASGPIVIDGQRDVVISGLRITNPTGTCIQINGGASNIVIENNEIGPCGAKGVDITSKSDHVTVRSNYIHDIQNEAVMSYDASDIAVDANVMVNVESGYEMWGPTNGNLSFTNNHVTNVSRRSGSLNGGNIAMAAFVYGGGIRINDNTGINILGESNPEDLINIYKSEGNPNDPIQIKGNRFKGGGPSDSGGGIILGDQGGAYQVAEDNILVNPGQYGLAVAGGHDNVMQNNQVYSDNQRSFTNIGLVVLRFNHENDGTPPGGCYGNTVASNDITWWKGPNYENNGLPASLDPSYNPNVGADGLAPNCGSVTGWDTNRLDTQSSKPANLDMSIWDPAWDTP